MAGGLTVWRRLGGFMAVCFLSLLVLAPSFDRCLCYDTAVSTEAQFVAAPATSETGTTQDKGSKSCVRGHCHQPAAVVPSEIASAVAPPAQSSRHQMAEVAVPPCYLHFGLIRPPRA